MKIIPLTPQKSLGKDLLGFRPEEAKFETFKRALAIRLTKIDEAEREDNQEMQIQNFLRDAFYNGSHL